MVNVELQRQIFWVNNMLSKFNLVYYCYDSYEIHSTDELLSGENGNEDVVSDVQISGVRPTHDTNPGISLIEDYTDIIKVYIDDLGTK